MNTKGLTFSLLCILVLFTGCEPRSSTPLPEAAVSTPKHKSNLPERDGFVSYLELKAYTDFSQSAQSAQELDAKLSVLLYNPTEANLEATQQQWRKAYSQYLETLIYAYLPIQDPQEWYKQNIDYQSTINALDSWPIEGGYIDYVEGYPFSGIVNDLTLTLNLDSLLSQHGFADPTNASVGFHALEFMLWGDNGQRPATDFAPQDNTTSVVESEHGDANATKVSELSHKNSRSKVQNKHRRRQYVQLVSEQLQKHLHRLQRRWEPSNGYYAERLHKSTSNQVVQALFIATQRLISEELINKRLDGNSSEFSATSWADSAAIVNSIRQIFVADHVEINALSSLLPEDQQDVVGQWQKQLDDIDASLRLWEQAEHNDHQARQECRLGLIGLLSLLKRSADILDIHLPNVN